MASPWSAAFNYQFGSATLGSFLYASGANLKSAALGLWQGQPLLAPYYVTGGWVVASGALVTTPVSGVTGAGAIAAFADGASGAWVLEHYGDLLGYAAGGAVSIYPTTNTAAIFTGGTLASGYPYGVDTNGALTTLVLGTATQLASGFGQFARHLGSYGATLYSLLPAALSVGTFALASQTTGSSGVIAAPFTGAVDVLAVSPVTGKIAVGGWNPAVLPSGYAALAIEPTGALLLGVNIAAHVLDVYAGSGSGIWAIAQSVSGAGSPVAVAWTPNSEFALTCDPTNNAVSIYANTFGVLALSQTLTVSGASAVAITSDSLNGLVAQAGVGALTPIVYNGATWAASGSVSLASPLAVTATGAASAVAATASGIAYLSLIAGAWSVTASGALPFTPLALSLDPNSAAIYAVGAAAGSGYLGAVSGAVTLASGHWTGNATDVLFDQGQVAVLDSTNAYARVYGLVSGIFSAATPVAAPPGATKFALSPLDVFAAGASTTWQYLYGAPYTLNRRQSGQVSIYNGSSWSNAALGVTGVPSALAWDASGNVTVATLTNSLVSVSSGGVVQGVSGLAQIPQQTQAVPLGVSALLYVGQSLYATTILNDALLKLM